jgi:hypothetical protein
MEPGKPEKIPPDLVVCNSSWRDVRSTRAGVSFHFPEGHFSPVTCASMQILCNALADVTDPLADPVAQVRWFVHLRVRIKVRARNEYPLDKILPAGTNVLAGH